MNILQCVITDDEPIARQILENYINDTPYLTLAATCKNAFEVMEVLQKQSVDILFLDINMPKLSGLSLLKTMEHKPNVIITTAYSEYAVEGFELSVVDYLLKPFSLERFLQAVMKVKLKMKDVVVEPNIVTETVSKDSLFVKSDKKIIKINLEEISHIEAYGNYIKIYSDKMILTPQTLTHFLEELPNTFVRIHKSFVINFNHLKQIDGNQITLQNGVKLPIGKSYRKGILDRI